MMFTFDKTSDYKKEFSDTVSRIVMNDINDTEVKNEIIRDVTNTYVAEIGERPESSELGELSSWLIFGRKGLSIRKKIEVKALESLEGLNGRNFG
ncbi:hypothetical protein [Bacillus cereus]|uniref:hypothetical protein n=1 Tax=Bacillus cereus TaxID=1396 RepID=UPI001D0E6AEB|nr:hypothetical protein [Bacillus cereus]MCC2383535.1 hypothetical protein [Bacillus cereus]